MGEQRHKFNQAVAELVEGKTEEQADSKDKYTEPNISRQEEQKPEY